MRRPCLVLLLLLLGCEQPELLEAQKGMYEVADRWAWGIPPRCTDGPVEFVGVISTELGDAKEHGLMRWGEVDGLRLDVDRYGTIVDLLVTERSVFVSPWMPPPKAPPPIRGPLGARLTRVNADVRAVLQGSAPRGPSQFPAPSGSSVPGTPIGLGLNPPTWFSSSWSFVRSVSARPFPVRGLAFLPLAQTDDPHQIGCIEGHFVPERGTLWSTYVHDVRLITGVKAAGDEAGLGAAEWDDRVVSQLLRDGHGHVGYWLAERLRWRVVLDLLDSLSHEEMTALGFPKLGNRRIASLTLAQGVFAGTCRMLYLSLTDVYPLGAWEDVDRARVALSLERILPGTISQLDRHAGVTGYDSSRAAIVEPESWKIIKHPRVRQRIDDLARWVARR